MIIPDTVCYINKEKLLRMLDEELTKLYELLPDADKENPTEMELRYLGQYMQTEIIYDKIKEL